MTRELPPTAAPTLEPALSWAVAVTSRGYAALHPSPEVPRPGRRQQAAAVRDAFAPAAPLLARRAAGAGPVAPAALPAVRASDAAWWFGTTDGSVVAVVPPFHDRTALDEVAAALPRLGGTAGLRLVVPVGRRPDALALAARLPVPVTVWAYRADLVPVPVPAPLPVPAPREGAVAVPPSAAGLVDAA